MVQDSGHVAIALSRKFILGTCGIDFEPNLRNAEVDSGELAHVRPHHVRRDHMKCGRLLNLLGLFSAVRCAYRIGSPPCQPFCRVGKQMDENDNRSASFVHLLTLLKGLEVPPAYIFLENVKGFEGSQAHRRLLEVLGSPSFEEIVKLHCCMHPCQSYLILGRALFRAISTTKTTYMVQMRNCYRSTDQH